MWSRLFWKLAAERAAKSFAQQLALLWVADGVDVFQVQWQPALGLAFGMALLSVLTSLGSLSLPVGEPGTPSLVRVSGRHAAAE